MRFFFVLLSTTTRYDNITVDILILQMILRRPIRTVHLLDPSRFREECNSFSAPSAARGVNLKLNFRPHDFLLLWSCIVRKDKLTQPLMTEISYLLVVLVASTVLRS